MIVVFVSTIFVDAAEDKAAIKWQLIMHIFGICEIRFVCNVWVHITLSILSIVSSNYIWPPAFRPFLIEG